MWGCRSSNHPPGPVIRASTGWKQQNSPAPPPQPTFLSSGTAPYPSAQHKQVGPQFCLLPRAVSCWELWHCGGPASQCFSVLYERSQSLGSVPGARTCVCVWDWMTECMGAPAAPALAALSRLLSPSTLPTSPRLSAQAQVGGCHWEVTLTAVGDSGGAGKRSFCLPWLDTPLCRLRATGCTGRLSQAPCAQPVGGSLGDQLVSRRAARGQEGQRRAGCEMRLDFLPWQHRRQR